MAIISEKRLYINPKLPIEFCLLYGILVIIEPMIPVNIAYFIEKAREIMQKSHDPMHDIDHTSRVAELAIKLSRDIELSEVQREALVIAAWWHDAARIMTKKPSLIWMPFFDDLLSAIMLGWETFRGRVFLSSAGLATRLICCKSLGTGQFFTRVLLSKKNRLILNILKDADALDVLRTDRVERMFELVEDSAMYHMGYKVMIWWMLSSHHLYMKTEAAKKYIMELIENFIAWVEEASVMTWHIEQFGEAWVRRNIARAHDLLLSFQQLNEQAA